MVCLRYLIWAASLLCSWKFVQALPVYVVDDMVFGDEQYLYLKNGVRSRNMLLNPHRYWPNSTVPYRYGPGIQDPFEIEMIGQALAKISEQTCIEFVESADTDDQSVIIQRIDSGCWAAVGYQGSKDQDYKQELNLGPSCMNIGKIQHEVMHVLGFLHMQCDPRRDEFININYENITPGNEKNFDIYHNSGDFGVGYDYDSLMHYGEKFFSKNNLPTITPKQEGVQIGQRIGMSPKDVLKINLAYCQNKF